MHIRMLETFCNKSTIHALQTYRGFIAFHRLFEAPFRLKKQRIENVYLKAAYITWSTVK